MTRTWNNPGPCPYLPHLRQLPSSRFEGTKRDYSPPEVESRT